jgi:hypothetical protein
VFDDSADALARLLEVRGFALGGLGRTHEKVEQMSRAALLPESGHANTSQAIDLAMFYCELERPNDALVAVKDVTDLSPFGRMRLARVRQCAALELHDPQGAADSFRYLQEHQGDAMDSYEYGLIDQGNFDAAVALMVRRLSSFDLRSDALREVQTYRQSPPLPHQRRQRELFHALLQRKEVEDAVAKVGRIERFDISPGY